MRGRHLATDMLEWVLAQPACRHVTVLETTVTPSNKASEKFFRRFAESRKARCDTSTFLETAQLGQEDHEAEILFRIRPL
jgi:L-2,4-diaminobutyric acid acetyltransferase